MRITAVLLSVFLAGALRAQTVSPKTNLTERAAQILAAAASEKWPRFNGPTTFGVRPHTPFLQTLTATGNHPMTISVEKLSKNLRFDATTGIISGTLGAEGWYPFTAHASNSEGSYNVTASIFCGNRIAWLPPLGWNSYDAFGDSVREDEV